MFPYYEKDKPRKYADLGKMTTMFVDETLMRLEGYPDWIHCKPEYKESTYPNGEKLDHWQPWGTNLITYDNFDEAEEAIKEYMSLVDDNVFYERITSFFRNKSRLEQERAEFSVLLQKEIEKIVLGDDLKGSCSICKRFRLI